MRIMNDVTQAIASLKTSNDLIINTSTYQITFANRNQGMRPHKKIDIESGHGESNLVILRNNQFWIGVAPYPPQVIGEARIIPFESKCFQSFFKSPITAPNWINQEMVSVILPNYIIKYDKYNTPIFADTIEFDIKS